MTSRGPYDKGLAARERLLRAAARAASDPAATLSLRTLASAASLTEAGALHHFGSRDGILVAAAAAAGRDRGYTDPERSALWCEALRIALDRSSPAGASARELLAGVADTDVATLFRSVLESATGPAATRIGS